MDHQLVEKEASSMRYWHLIFAVTILLFLTGCTANQPLEGKGFIIAMGIDKAEDHQISVTFQMANPEGSALQLGSSPNEESSAITTIIAPNILGAKELGDILFTREITFSHLKAIIVSEEFAKSSSFPHILASAVIDMEMRRDIHIIVSKEKARDLILANKPKMETTPHKYYYFMEKRWRETGYVPISDVNRYFTRTAGGLFLAVYATAEKEEEVKQNGDEYKAGEVPKKSGNPVEMMGSAVMKNGRMIGTLNAEETRLSLLLRRSSLMQSMIISLPDPIKPDYQISVNLVRTGPTTIELDTDKEPVKVKASVPLKVEVLSNPALVTYATSPKNTKKLEQAIEEFLEGKADELIKKTQTEFEAEPFQWYLAARKNFWTNDAYRKYGWEDQYARANVDVGFDLSVSSFGDQITPSRFKDKKGEAE